jgi:hypothetical protein
MTDATTTAQENVRRARADLGETVDALKQKLSMSELISEVQTYLGDSGGMSNMMNNLSRQAQSNPMALAMIGAGFAWLMMSANGRGGGGSRPHDYSRHTTNSMGAKVGDAAASARQASSDVAGRVGSAMSEAGSAVASAAESVSSGVASAASASSRAIGDVGDAVAEAPYELQRVGEDMVERHPLVVGAAAIALGAAIGAALPRTDLEDRQLGDASEKMKDAVSAQGEKVMRSAEDIASKVSDVAAREADRQGLVPGTAGGAADQRPIAERVKEVGREAAKAARDEVDRRSGGRGDTGNGGQTP